MIKNPTYLGNKAPLFIQQNKNKIISRVEKYRPSKLEELVSHEDIIRTSNHVPPTPKISNN